jgi:hypothetical protein
VLSPWLLLPECFLPGFCRVPLLSYSHWRYAPRTMLPTSMDVLSIRQRGGVLPSQPTLCGVANSAGRICLRLRGVVSSSRIAARHSASQPLQESFADLYGLHRVNQCDLTQAS